MSDDKKYFCTFCDYSTPAKANLTRHSRMHLGELPFPCKFPGCSAAFANELHLVEHVRVHTGEKPFPCTHPGCLYSSTQKQHLASHMRIHSNERPYTCSFCSKFFRQLSHLNTHIRTHTGEKPYSCSEAGCHFAGSSSGSLTQHKKKSHSNATEFKCKVPGCDFSTVRKYLLQQHLFRHSTKKQFQCDFKNCFYSSERNSDLTRHQLSHRSPVIQSPRKSQRKKPKIFYGDEEDPKLRARAVVIVTDILKNKRAANCKDDVINEFEDPSLDLDHYEGEIRDRDAINGDECSEGMVEDEEHFEDPPRKQKQNLVCKICGWKSKKVRKYKMHLEEHGQKNELLCSLCDSVCFGKKSLSNHWRTHHKDKEEDSESDEELNQQVDVVVEPLEVFKFYTKFSSSSPLSLDSPEEIYFSCNICLEQFDKEMHVLTHLRDHTGEELL